MHHQAKRDLTHHLLTFVLVAALGGQGVLALAHAIAHDHDHVCAATPIVESEGHGHHEHAQHDCDTCPLCQLQGTTLAVAAHRLSSLGCLEIARGTTPVHTSEPDHDAHDLSRASPRAPPVRS